MILWSDEAKDDLVGILNWIYERNHHAAKSVGEDILGDITFLGRYPYLGREGRYPGTRELVISGRPYIVIYQTFDATIRIARVLHGAQLWPPEV